MALQLHFMSLSAHAVECGALHSRSRVDGLGRFLGRLKQRIAGSGDENAELLCKPWPALTEHHSYEIGKLNLIMRLGFHVHGRVPWCHPGLQVQ